MYIPYVPWPTYPFFYPAPCQCNRCPTCGQPQVYYNGLQVNQGFALQQGAIQMGQQGMPSQQQGGK